MSETTVQRERERDFERFLTFVDAIVAIAITLLVLPLVDVVRGPGDDSSTWNLVHDNRAVIGAFFLSFAVIANLWLSQHRILRHVVAANAALTRLLLLWTVTIVFLPFPTALVASKAGDEALTKAIYVGCMGFSSLLLALVCVVAGRNPDLRDPEPGPSALPSFAVAVTFVVALAVMLLVPRSSYWPLLLLLVSDRVADLFAGRLGRGRGRDRVR
jgi:uncharacterized membrane protein